MALQDLLTLSSSRNKIGMSEERLNAVLPIIRQYVSYWREYPDLFIDFMAGGEHAPKESLKLYFYQRCFLRACMRYKYVYCVFPRAYSKSFLAMLILMVRCILFPGAKLFVTSGGKEQSSGIMREKIQEICTLVPAFRKEILKTQEGKDYAKYVFRNGSVLDNVAARESSRGTRRHGGLMEECVGIDGQILNEVILPKYFGAQQCELLMRTRRTCDKRVCAIAC